MACDQVGTPKVVTDAAGTVVKQLDHDSFGQLVSDSAPAFYLPIGFAGGLADADTGLVRFGFRDYDPATGRWTAKDPIFFKSGQANLYEYCGSDPVGFRDLLGLRRNRFIDYIADKFGFDRWDLGDYVEERKQADGIKPNDHDKKRVRKYAEDFKSERGCTKNEKNKESIKEINMNDIGHALFAVGAGYITYRAVRLLPSLFPPLWPTIPANVILP